MQESVFKEFLSSETYGVFAVISFLIFIGASILIAWRIASESRYERECRKTEETYERYILNHKENTTN